MPWCDNSEVKWHYRKGELKIQSAYRFYGGKTLLEKVWGYLSPSTVALNPRYLSGENRLGTIFAFLITIISEFFRMLRSFCASGGLRNQQERWP